jgi:regulator of protease activity HflC (stomatin/prohibitin superfamily)
MASARFGYCDSTNVAWFLLGKFEDVRGAGLTLVFVPIRQMVRVSLRTVTMQIPSQKIITKDNVSIDIAAVAYYHISDPEKAVIVIENVYNAINQISQTTVRNVVGRFSLDQLLSDTASINEQIKNVIDGHTEPWGTQVTAVEIKDITLPDNMQRAMAKEAEAERERRAKIVAAEGEYQASVKLGQAADIITQHPVALQLRTAADDGRNCDRKELNDHLPRTIYDDSAGSYRHVE